MVLKGCKLREGDLVTGTRRGKGTLAQKGCSQREGDPVMGRRGVRQSEDDHGIEVQTGI